MVARKRREGTQARTSQLLPSASVHPSYQAYRMVMTIFRAGLLSLTDIPWGLLPNLPGPSQPNRIDIEFNYHRSLSQHVWDAYNSAWHTESVKYVFSNKNHSFWRSHETLNKSLGPNVQHRCGCVSICTRGSPWNCRVTFPKSNARSKDFYVDSESLWGRGEWCYPADSAGKQRSLCPLIYMCPPELANIFETWVQMVSGWLLPRGRKWCIKICQSVDDLSEDLSTHSVLHVASVCPQVWFTLMWSGPMLPC